MGIHLSIKVLYFREYVCATHINNTKQGLPQDRECLGLNYEYQCPVLLYVQNILANLCQNLPLCLALISNGDYSDLVPNLSQGGALVQKKIPASGI